MHTLGIYIQVPFCAAKCSFCNFSSRVERASAFDAYCATLEKEIEGLPASYHEKGVGTGLLPLPVDTLYVGGGSPSLLGGERLAKIARALARQFKFLPPVEFTLEMTPGSGESGFLEQAALLGVNRLSIGAQSFADRELRSVGRLHSAADTERLVEAARRRGFGNISLDLIAGLPYQDEASWLASLRRALRLRPEHLSLYLFEIDAKSRLGREVLQGGSRYHASAVPGEEFMVWAYEQGRELLERGGYKQYEISNFALPGFESNHNRKYWQLEPYIGLGAGAHSFDGLHRWANAEQVETYRQKPESQFSPIAEVRTLGPDEQVEEFFFLGLRQRQGVNLSLAGERWGRERLRGWKPTLDALIAQGWLERTAAGVRLAGRAYVISNEVFQEFVGV